MHRLLTIALILVSLPIASKAAQLSLTRDADFGCLIALEGQIAEGDSATLLALLRQAASQPRYADTIYVNEDPAGGPPNIAIYKPMNLCLDSPGGSLTEAMALTRLVHGSLGTVVRAGARCESACALVFMAGSHSTETDYGVSVNRFLHVDGRLGFHAPSLTVPEGRYDAASVARAYEISVAVSELIFRNLVTYRFAPSLAARMHATPATDMAYITTVQEAARWRIGILGVDRPTALPDQAIRQACSNLFLSAWDQVSSDPDNWPRSLQLPSAPVDRDRDSFRYTAFGQEGAGTCELRRIDPDDEYGANRLFWGGEPMIADSVWADGHVRDSRPAVFFGLVQNYMAWPGEMPLAALPRAGRSQPAQTAGLCFVLDAEQSLTDREPCSRSREATSDGGVIDTHTWPSGARTTLDYRAETPRVNGTTGRWGYWPLAPLPGATPNCVVNTGSGNTFCFQPGAT